MERVKITFMHENAFEGGPGIESAWAIRKNDNYVLDNILFYAKEYAYLDVVRAKERDGELIVTGLVEASGHSLVRILFFDLDEVSSVRHFLQSEGCDSELSDLPQLISVDIPPDISYSRIKSYLDAGELEEKWTYEEACIAQSI
jgi:hypothetical protein